MEWRRKRNRTTVSCSQEPKGFCRNGTDETNHCAPRLHGRTSAVERMITSFKRNSKKKQFWDVELQSMRPCPSLSIQTGLNLSPLELPLGRKPTTEITHLV